MRVRQLLFALVVTAAGSTSAVAQRTLGTEFWGCDMENEGLGITEPFGFAVANSSAASATVSVETAAGVRTTRNVAAGRVLTFDFDRSLMMLETSRAPNAYRITSTVPVAVYQFNPLADDLINTTDASTLLPLPSLGTSY